MTALTARPEGDVAIEAAGLSVWFPDGGRALNDVSMAIPSRRITVLFGPARGGKTTLLRVLNRMAELVPGLRMEGDVRLHGRSVFEPNVDVSALRRSISMVFAVPTPLPGSILDNLTYGLRMAGARDEDLLRARAEWALRQAALWDEVADRLGQSASALSGGQKQRLCLARSLALDPQVILLDNPTSGLDPLSTALVEEALQGLKARYTIVMVPHSVQQGARIADHAAFLLGGEVIETGDAEAVFVAPRDKRTEDYVTGRFG